MNEKCFEIQERLADTGPTAFREDPEGRAHLVECEECFAFLENLGEVAGLLESAPAIDAPDRLVDRALLRVRAEGLDVQEVPADEASAPVEQPILARPIETRSVSAKPSKKPELPAVEVVIVPPAPEPFWRRAMSSSLAVVFWLPAKFFEGLARAFSPGGPSWQRKIVYAAGAGGSGLALMFLFVVTFGDNVRGMYGASADALQGSEERVLYEEAPVRFARLIVPDEATEHEPHKSLDGFAASDDLAFDLNGSRGEIAATPMPQAAPEPVLPASPPPPPGTPSLALLGQLEAKEQRGGKTGALGKDAYAAYGNESAFTLDGNEIDRRIADPAAHGLRGRATLQTLLTGERSNALRKRRVETVQVIRGTGSGGGGGVGDDEWGEAPADAPAKPADGRFDEKPVARAPARSRPNNAFGEAGWHAASDRAEPESEEEAVPFGDELDDDLSDFDGKLDAVATKQNKGRKRAEKERWLRDSTTEQPRQRIWEDEDRLEEKVVGKKEDVSRVERKPKKKKRVKRKAKRPLASPPERQARVSGRFGALGLDEGLGSPPPPRPAQRFLERWDRTDGLRFKSPTGYWQNTYVPGDPKLRLLQSNVLGFDRNLLLQYTSARVRLEELARQNAQPFDAPTHAGLAVYLHASKTHVTEPTRMLVQVGLQATPRHSGHRPAMNVGVVLDLRGDIDAQVEENVRELVTQLNRAKDIADHFTLVIAGKPGGVAVKADSFRHGPLTVTLQQLFGERPASPTAPTFSLTQAVQAAYDAVGGEDDPNAPLGTSVVLLVTPQSLGWELYPIESLAHARAVAGIPMSVVAVGAGPPAAELDRLTLAGQGNRRSLTNPNDAKQLVEKELSAVSRVIARAVRLRIRLQPGVKLVDVLGSFSLSEAQAERVRKAEQSIDQRISRNLGIVADRGEDEEGIQIVIPAFYAGDGHVILLDVLVSGPGPVADVTVRYKDLVQLRNGIARDNLTLGRRRVATGPLERNVLKNLLAHELSTSLARASELLKAGDPNAARRVIEQYRAVLDGMRYQVAGLYRDRDVINDVAMLDEYALMLGTGAVHGSERSHLVDSLRFAGRVKLLPRPEVE